MSDAIDVADAFSLEQETYENLLNDCRLNMCDQFIQRVAAYSIDVRAGGLDLYLLEAADNEADNVVQAAIILGKYKPEEIRALGADNLSIQSYVSGHASTLAMALWFINFLNITKSDILNKPYQAYYAVLRALEDHKKEHADWLLDYFNLHEEFDAYLDAHQDAQQTAQQDTYLDTNMVGVTVD